jgi:hypothetical protein
MMVLLNIYIAIALIIVGAYWGQDCHGDKKQARRLILQGLLVGAFWPIMILVFIFQKRK